MTIHSEEVVKLLRAIADRYRVFGDPAVKGSRRWDGTQYVAVDDPEKFPWDRQAGLWASVLETMADMLTTQAGPISDEQRAYLRRRLFGGMGALHDYVLPGRLGTRADAANEEVERIRGRLHYLLSQ